MGWNPSGGMRQNGVEAAYGSGVGEGQNRAECRPVSAAAETGRLARSGGRRRSGRTGRPNGRRRRRRAGRAEEQRRRGAGEQGIATRLGEVEWRTEETAENTTRGRRERRGRRGGRRAEAGAGRGADEEAVRTRERRRGLSGLRRQLLPARSGAPARPDGTTLREVDAKRPTTVDAEACRRRTDRTGVRHGLDVNTHPSGCHGRSRDEPGFGCAAGTFCVQSRPCVRQLRPRTISLFSAARRICSVTRGSPGAAHLGRRDPRRPLHPRRLHGHPGRVVPAQCRCGGRGRGGQARRRRAPGRRSRQPRRLVGLGRLLSQPASRYGRVNIKHTFLGHCAHLLYPCSRVQAQRRGGRGAVLTQAVVAGCRGRCRAATARLGLAPR